jgi:hypothetical protein
VILFEETVLPCFLLSPGPLLCVCGTIPGLGEFISGVILFEETLYQRAADGTPFVELMHRQNIIPGIKVRGKGAMGGGDSRSGLVTGVVGWFVVILCSPFLLWCVRWTRAWCRCSGPTARPSRR